MAECMDSLRASMSQTEVFHIRDEMEKTYRGSVVGVTQNLKTLPMKLLRRLVTPGRAIEFMLRASRASLCPTVEGQTGGEPRWMFTEGQWMFIEGLGEDS
ncbi:hypothetical protein EYF80_036335 [Liparis tanakae]|uniref:Uncharacterized protein n=1 Tax=Liparis tanakae TaxID=230148 RepID=A0A4Z2GJJ4_9TELE|nr:hypothetical protein EYF80_036335 [Liparis tanakae]